MATVDELRAIKRKYASDLLRRPGISGIDISTDESGEATLMVHLDTKSVEVRDSLPTALDGYPVEYVYTGPVRKQSKRRSG
jgi:hypothetical protein